MQLVPVLDSLTPIYSEDKKPELENSISFENSLLLSSLSSLPLLLAVAARLGSWSLCLSPLIAAAADRMKKKSQRRMKGRNTATAGKKKVSFGTPATRYSELVLLHDHLSVTSWLAGCRQASCLLNEALESHRFSGF